jgi:phosphosulfolactate synthase
MIDPGLSRDVFTDIIRSHHRYIDFVKFGWGSGLLTEAIRDKIAVLREHDVDFWCGGTLFEIAYAQGVLSQYTDWLARLGARHIEISDGTIVIPHKEKVRLIRELSCNFKVLSEVGKKAASVQPVTSEWISMVRDELDAGACWVILEGREAGTSGVFSASGAVRDNLIHDILASGVDVDKLFFEAPHKSQQTWFISHIGPELNFANIASDDIIGLETLRRGLRSDTAMLMMNELERCDLAG